jgi:nitrite reductase/ring-hydroxylating ferredoxin subunit
MSRSASCSAITARRYPLLLAVCFTTVVALHLLAGWRERKGDIGVKVDGEGWLFVGPVDSIADKRATIVAAPGGERIAVYRDGKRIGALSNLCAHQNGPIGEGCIIDGLVTCPWHGYQYRLADGCAPPPFTEKLATYRIRVRDGNIEVDPRPLPPGTPAAIDI